MYKHDDVKPDEASQLTKKQQVASMFDKIAGRYDFFNRLLSMGIDIGWRKKALNELATDKPQLMLDVATGTADLAIMAEKRLKPSKIIGIDISAKMLDVGKVKVDNKNLSSVIELKMGDSEAINFEENTFDAVTVAYGIRNFEDLDKGLSEIRRVLKPSKKLVVLEFSKPRKSLWQKLYSLYMGIVAPNVVGAMSRNKQAYKYLNDSVIAFPERANLIAVLEKCGFKNCRYKELSFGICCIYVAEK
jgi:demethylmenaquinone methyltransferase / 2-methoxy-6-polyprenyl-1,4-benzoquinol methylase